MSILSHAPHDESPSPGDVLTDAWQAAEPALRAAAGGADVEVRYALGGQAAVLQLPPSDAPHVTAAPEGERTVGAQSGDARAWATASTPFEEPERLRSALLAATHEVTSQVLQALRMRRDRVSALLVEGIVHRARADIGALAGAWDAASTAGLTEEERAEFEAAVRTTKRDAERSLDDTAAYQRALFHLEQTKAIDLLMLLEDELLPGTPVAAPAERPFVCLPEGVAAWCVRALGERAGDPRFGDGASTIGVEPHPMGWALSCGAPQRDTVERLAWPGAPVDELDWVGGIAVANGGDMWLCRTPQETLRAWVVLPAAAPPASKTEPGGP